MLMNLKKQKYIIGNKEFLRIKIIIKIRINFLKINKMFCECALIETNSKSWFCHLFL